MQDLRFTEVCRKAFQEKDSDARKVLNLLANAPRKDGCLRFDSSNQSLLESSGIVIKRLAEGGVIIPSEESKRLEEIKNETRLSVHRELELQENSEFEELITLVRGKLTALVGNETKEQANSMTNGFRLYMANYGKNLVIQPMIEGLRNVLSKQLDSQFCMQWRLDDAAFTERGDRKFLEDTLNLFSCGIMIPNLYCEDFEDPRFRFWTLSPTLSDTRVKKLLSALPNTDFRATGSVTESKINRTNRGGSLDYSGWFERRCPWLMF